MALVVAAMAGAEAFLIPLVASRMTAVVESDLLHRAQMAARIAASPSPPSPPASPSAWDALARSLAEASGSRVTLFGRDGQVVGESDRSSDASREHVASEPETRAARTVGEGSAIRADPNDGKSTLFVAVSVENGEGPLAIVRVAEPMSVVDGTRADVRRVVWYGGGTVLALAWILALLVSGRVSRVVGELRRAARRMSEGDLSVRTRLPGHDELAELGHALDRLAGGLGKTLAELRAERDLQKRILEAMHEGVVVVDESGRIVLVNPAIRSMLLLGTEAIGKLLIETVRHAELHKMFERARAELEDRPVEIELPGLKPRRILVQAAPLSGDEGMLFVFVDVTELRRLESLRRDFVANASHELRTPIAAVRSATETLRSGALDDRLAAVRFVDIIERNAQRLQSVVEDMLELSKLESNEFKLKRERVELQRVVPIVLALFRERAEKKGVRLAAELPAALAPIDGDARALEHVLSNLVDNAVKYCSAGSRILVGATEDEDRVRLVVSDTGPGIAPEHLSRVFERFYRVDAGRSRELGGTGLGLSIVKHMVEAMRGKVSVESVVGKGSTFAVSLHRADAAASAESGTVRLG
jgi:two-component system phosphate regulon sensor histidine kinase PhoR